MGMKILIRISFLVFVTFCFSLIAINISEADVTVPWSTTYNCAEWVQGQTLKCDGISSGGGWTTSGGHGEQITSTANYPVGGGGRGQRHWIGDGANNNSGGVKINFNSSPSELWIRYYIRYKAGFKWTSLGYQKLIYFDNGTVLELVDWDSVNIYKSGNHQSNTGGWDTMYKNGPIDPTTGHRISDGSWHCMEWHIRLSGGLGEAWVDGVKYISINGLSYGSDLDFLFGSNANNPGNGGDMYMDLDDLAISNTGYIGPLTSPSPPQDLRIIP
jgi:hypothetical protein